ncbi:MAG: STAS domain-containing protein [Anaerolineales bacterium]|nr:STAS domain-containing protein [Anaerolineales bacterium]
MGRLVTRLTRDANRIWLLEFLGAADQEVFYQVTETEIPAILKILERSEVGKLVVDLTTSQDFNSRGLEFLHRMYQQLAGRNIAIILRNPSVHLRQVLRIMQLDQAFEIEFDESF